MAWCDDGVVVVVVVEGARHEEEDACRLAEDGTSHPS